MLKKLLFITLFLATSLFSKTIDKLYEDVSKVKIEINGYSIGKSLTKEQKKLALESKLKANMPNTIKFQDKNLNIVVEAEKFRVLVIYKNFEDVNSTSIKEIVSNLIYNYNEPTLTSHGKMIYWFYNRDGKKMTKEDIDTLKGEVKKDSKNPQNNSLANMLDKMDNKDENLNKPILTLKLSSDKDIMDEENFKNGKVYYILSSEVILKEFIKK